MFLGFSLSNFSMKYLTADDRMRNFKMTKKLVILLRELHKRAP